jgi:putative transposase
MPNYRRNLLPGGMYFFTVVTAGRRPWLCRDEATDALRRAGRKVRASLPFEVVAWVLLPEHLHCIWTLPTGDSDFPGRRRLIKGFVTRTYGKVLSAEDDQSPGQGRMPSVWQERYWEHTIRDEADLAAHMSYIHFNPVKHGHCRAPSQWRLSTFHAFVRRGLYPKDWGAGMEPTMPEAVGME